MNSEESHRTLKSAAPEPKPIQSGRATTEASRRAAVPGIATTQIEPNQYVDDHALEIKRQHVEMRRGIGTALTAWAAKQNGADLTWFSGSEVRARVDGRTVLINAHYGSESRLSAGIVGDKDLAKTLMSKAGVPVPLGQVVNSEQEALDAQRAIASSVVVKPTSGALGRGVTVDVTNPDDIREAYRRAKRPGSSVLVEQFISGKEYRVHATPNECVGIFERLLPSVTGDGVSTIRELITVKNSKRKLNVTTHNYMIPLDAVTEGVLKRQSLNWDSVLPDGQVQVVRNVNGLTSGGDSAGCFYSASDELKSTAALAVSSIPGMTWGGVDIIVEDSTGVPYVMEVNTNAAISGSAFPVFGEATDIATKLWVNKIQYSTPDSVISPTLLSQSLQIPVGLAELQSKTLLEHVQDRLHEDGWNIVHHNKRIWSATSHGRDTMWFSGLFTKRDSALSLRPLRRRQLMVRLLRAAKVPTPRGKLVNNTSQLTEFANRVSLPISLKPLSPDNNRLTPNVLQVGDKSALREAQFPKTKYAQVYRSGTRLEIIASTRTAYCAVTADPGAALSGSDLARASKIAVQAVRAMPQLRWAVVSIILPKATARAPRAMVEDMYTNLRFDGGGSIVSGSMDDVYKMIAR